MDYTRGNICHIEIPAPDIEAAKAFYGGVFGWTFSPMHEGYEFFDAGNIAGGLDPTATPSHHGTVIVLMVEDVDAALAAAAASGGKIVAPRIDLPGGHGSYGYFEDPAGNKLGVWMRGADA